MDCARSCSSSFSRSPILGLYVVVFYVVFNVMKDYALVPLLRNVTMQLNPVHLLFVTPAMTYLFGIWEAIVSTPLAGFAKAYYDVFYLGGQKDEPHIDEKVEAMVRREDRGGRHAAKAAGHAGRGCTGEGVEGREEGEQGRKPSEEARRRQGRQKVGLAGAGARCYRPRPASFLPQDQSVPSR